MVPEQPGAGEDAREEIEFAIEGCRHATGRLLDTVAQLGDTLSVQPSRLDGWSIGHVLTHLARNADSFVRVLSAAANGREVVQYAGGDPGKAQDIEAGAKRPAAELVEDLRVSAARLDTAFTNMPEAVWQGRGFRNGGEPLPCRLLPIARWGEVEVHHVDLGLGYTVSDWSADFVALALPRALETVPERIEDVNQRAEFLAWVYGRAPLASGLVLRPY